MSDSTRTNFDKKFIDEAVRLALSTSQPISQTARELGVKESTLCITGFQSINEMLIMTTHQPINLP